ncbi:hypothetical protein [Olivibacter jilunii]|nr:hypothetical protein [Olivibacter jilunii]
MSCLLWKIDNGKIVEVYNFPEDQHEVDAFTCNLNLETEILLSRP